MTRVAVYSLLQFAFLAVFLSGANATDSVMDAPQQLWASTLGQSLDGVLGAIELGNAVTVNPEGTLLYTTRNNGRLDVLDARNGQEIYSYMPQSVGALPVTCESGVAFGSDMEGNTIAVYAIVDKAPDSSGVSGGEVSRVVIVTNGGTTIRESEPLNGIITGTPVITKGTFPGRYVFLTRNTQTGSTGEPLLGHFTVIDMIEERIVFTEDSTEVDGVVAPYGPIGVSSSPLFGGKYVGGFGNPGDMAVWTSSFEEGSGPVGFTRAFQFPPEFTPGFSLPLNSIPLREARWNAVAAPTLSRDGQNLFIGIRGSGVRAWVGDRSFQDLPSWSTQFSEEGRPIPYAGTLSADEDVIYYTSGSSIAAVSVFDGSFLWEYDAVGSFTSSPKVSPDDSRLYASSATDGIVVLTTNGGNQVGTIACEGLDSSVIPCLSRVRGDFSFSSNGQIMYFGDIGGNVRAVSLGDSEVAPVTSPTPGPTSDGQVSSPTGSSASDFDSKGSLSTSGLYVGLAIIIATSGFMVWLWANYCRNPAGSAVEMEIDEVESEMEEKRQTDEGSKTKKESSPKSESAPGKSNETTSNNIATSPTEENDEDEYDDDMSWQDPVFSYVS